MEKIIAEILDSAIVSKIYLLVSVIVPDRKSCADFCRSLGDILEGKVSGASKKSASFQWTLAYVDGTIKKIIMAYCFQDQIQHKHKKC